MLLLGLNLMEAKVETAGLRVLNARSLPGNWTAEKLPSSPATMVRWSLSWNAKMKYPLVYPA
jgi:hypothetical protein